MADVVSTNGSRTADRGEEDPRRRLPAVGELLDEPALSGLQHFYGRRPVVVQVRAVLDQLRDRMAEEGGATVPWTVDSLAAAVESRLAERLGRPVRRVINATGIFVHTNLGRSPLPGEVAAALRSRLDAACDLEIDLESGERSDRNLRADRLLCSLTGAESALVVNNNAAALFLAVSVLAAGRQVLVSRGELIEIGGSFRIPDLLAAAGAELVEVGTTNRTRLADYRRALGERSALLLKVHPSNYRLVGFVEEVAAAELVALGREHGVPVMVDEGSGLLEPHPAPQLSGHPSLRQLIESGCDLACGSGDKVLGGPQAGLLVGSAPLVERCRRHPLYRALRPDRTTLVVLDEILRRRLRGESMPIDRLWVDPARHRARLERSAERLGAEIVSARAFVGGGAAAERPIEGEALALDGDEELARALRCGDPPVVGYAREGRVVLDLRTVDPADDDALCGAVEAARRATGG